MTNKTHTPAHTTQTADAQPVIYKIREIRTERGCTFDGRTFTTQVDLCDGSRNRIEFSSIRRAESFARAYAEGHGFKYLEIGDLSTPGIGETFIEIATA